MTKDVRGFVHSVEDRVIEQVEMMTRLTEDREVHEAVAKIAGVVIGCLADELVKYMATMSEASCRGEGK